MTIKKFGEFLIIIGLIVLTMSVLSNEEGEFNSTGFVCAGLGLLLTITGWYIKDIK